MPFWKFTPVHIPVSRNLGKSHRYCCNFSLTSGQRFKRGHKNVPVTGVHFYWIQTSTLVGMHLFQTALTVFPYKWGKRLRKSCTAHLSWFLSPSNKRNVVFGKINQSLGTNIFLPWTNAFFAVGVPSLERCTHTYMCGIWDLIKNLYKLPQFLKHIFVVSYTV